MKRAIQIVFVVVMAWGSSVYAGLGSCPLGLVPVGNAGNTGELSGASAGGFGPDRICGVVDYKYNIGKYEVTAEQYTAFLNAVGKTDPYGLYSTAMWSSTWGCKIQRSGSSGDFTYSVASDRANRPVDTVSWGDAARFANWLHNGEPTGTLTGDPAEDAGLTEDGAYHLNGATSDAALLNVSREADWKWAITSEDEWYKAAYHKNNGVTGDYFDYPMNSDSAPSNDLLDPDGGNNANFYQNGYTIGSPYFNTEVGEFELSKGPYGTFDQGGNLWEWNESILNETARGQRGASFGGASGTDHTHELHASGRNQGVPTLESYDVGFRIVQTPEPTTLVLTATGLPFLLKRKRFHRAASPAQERKSR